MSSVVNRVASVAFTAAVLAACGTESAGPSVARAELGVLQLEGYLGQESVSPQDTVGRDPTILWTVPPEESVLVLADVLVVPDEVDAGEPFTVAVTTIGDGGCWSADSQEVEITGRTVELTPHDSHNGSNICTDILLHLLHESTVTLEEAGEWTIRVSGRIARHGDETWETPVTAEKTILVR